MAALRRLLAYDLHAWYQSDGRPERPIYQDIDAVEPPWHEWTGIQTLRMIHGVLSPADWQGTELVLDVRDDWRGDVADLMDDVDLDGWLQVSHPWRILPHRAEELRDAGFGAGGRGSLWAGVREDALELGDWHEYVYDSPHVHVVAVSGRRWSGDEHVAGGDQVGDRDDVWIRVRDVDDADQIGDVVGYLLSHAATWHRKHMLTWHGDLSYCRFSESDLPPAGRRRLDQVLDAMEERVQDELGYAPYEPDPCPTCGSTRRCPLVDVYRRYRERLDSSVYHAEAVRRAIAVLSDGWGRIQAQADRPPDPTSADLVEAWMIRPHWWTEDEMPHRGGDVGPVLREHIPAVYDDGEVRCRRCQMPRDPDQDWLAQGAVAACEQITGSPASWPDMHEHPQDADVDPSTYVVPCIARHVPRPPETTTCRHCGHHRDDHDALGCRPCGVTVAAGHTFAPARRAPAPTARSWPETPLHDALDHPHGPSAC